MSCAPLTRQSQLIGRCSRSNPATIDQAHFNKDFMAHLGHSPTDYLRLRRRVQVENPDYDRLLRTLPFD